jgi:hypothetical protein
MTPARYLHKIAVLYAAQGQENEDDVLSNAAGSYGYFRFLTTLGEFKRLKQAAQLYTGGLDTEGDSDGEYGLFWSDSVSQLVFHVATLMPTRADDPSNSVHASNSLTGQCMLIRSATSATTTW